MSPVPNKQLEFEAQLQQSIDRLEGCRAVALALSSDPRQQFATTFNRVMVGVNARYITRAYERPQAVLAAKVGDGSVRTTNQFMELMTAILTVTARHYRGRSHHDDNPKICLHRKDPGAPRRRERMPLFVRAPIDPNQFPAPPADSTQPLELCELIPMLLREARALNRLQLQVFRAVRRYERLHGTTFGAYRAVARLVVCDEHGRIQRFRKHVPEESGMLPKACIVRQVRCVFEEASRCIERRAYLRGYRLRWPG